MRANSTMILRSGRLAFCLMVAYGCAPDQFVSMGSDIGGAAGEVDSQPSASTKPDNTAGAGGSSAGAVEAGGTRAGAITGTSASGSSSGALGGSSSLNGTEGTGGDKGLVIGVLR